MVSLHRGAEGHNLNLGRCRQSVVCIGRIFSLSIARLMPTNVSVAGSFASAPAALAAGVDRRLPELAALESVVRYLQAGLHGQARIGVETVVRWRDVEFPIYSIALGSEDPKAPCLALVGGVHGLERIGIP